MTSEPKACLIAICCCMLVEASAGKPITSPAAYIFGACVRKWLSTGINPRSLAVTPAADRLSFSTLLFLPAATRNRVDGELIAGGKP